MENYMNPKEYTWFLSHPEIETEYAGEYIAISNERIVAHGKDFKTVLREAENQGVHPYIHKVSDKEKALVV